MIRHFAIATFRNMAANKLLSAISIAGLAVGIAVALLSGLVIRNQTRFDHFITGHERIVMLASDLDKTGEGPRNCFCASEFGDVGQFLAPKIPEAEAVTRLYLSGQFGDDPLPILAHGQVRAPEKIYWADPNVFDLLQLPVLHGELATALARPDGIVLPRAMARKYFGRDNAVGEVLMLDGRPMTVRAVIRDLPAQATTLQSGIFASRLAAFSKLMPPNVARGSPNSRALGAKGASPFATIYFRIKPGADLAAIGTRISRLMQPRNANIEQNYVLLPLDRVNLAEKFHPGIRGQLVTAGVIGLTVLLIAVINFINLMTVIAARREKEVGVRKSCGAGRLALMSQFLGEAMIAVALGAALALALAEWLMPKANAFLLTGMTLDYGEPLLLPAMLLAIAMLGGLAGAYPAFLLSAFRPATILRGWTKTGEAGGTQIVRSLLVALQFAILVALGIATITFWRQHQYAVNDAMRVDGEQVLLLRVKVPPAKPGSQRLPPGLVPSMADPRACPAALVDRLKQLPGVRQTVCSGDVFLKGNMGISWYATPTTSADVIPMQVDPAIFRFYGVKMVAGDPVREGVVLNQAAVRLLGFASPADAIGKSWMKPKALRDLWVSGGGLASPDAPQSRVVAVVEDFGFDPVSQAVRPAIFSADMMGGRDRLVHMRLEGQRIPETLAAIDRAWRESGQAGVSDRFFLDDYMQQQYLALSRQAQLYTMVCGIALFMACLGLVGIAVSTADRRTKEVGVRKAMGAGKGEILLLMLWQFSRPVLAANLIAWPVAFWAMRRWLSGFAYHVELDWWVFAAASATALLVALLAVTGQAWLTARRKPVLALRYE